MRSITARGDSRAIGAALGEEARQSLHEVVFPSEAYGALAPWLGSDRLAGLMAASRTAAPALFAEIEGIAAGAAAALEPVFLWNCRGDLPPYGAETEGCTTVMAPRNAGRPAVIAHNEDGGALLAGHCFMARVEPDPIGPGPNESSQGLGFTSFCYPGMLPGHTFAVNDAGLVQTINNISPHDLTVGVTRHMVCRALLACATLEDALGWLRRRDRAAGFHHNLGAAAEGRMVSVEAPASGCVVAEVTALRAHANHLIFADFAGAPQTVSPSTAARQKRADTLLPGRDDPLEILFDRENDDLPILCRGEAANGRAYTLATALFRLEPEGVSLEVFHGPDRNPVFRGEIALAVA